MNESIEVRISEIIDILDLPSLCVSVIQDTNWSLCHGLADRDQGIAADSQTRYRLGSITKIFTALVLMQLVEQGLVQLDDPVQRYIPEMPEVITFKHLATHTSGLPTMPPSVVFPDTPDDIQSVMFPTIETLIADLPNAELIADPGQETLYSNWGVGLLGHALAQVAGIGYREYVENHILKPLRMTNTCFDVGSLPHATGYITFSDPWMTMPPVDIGGFTPAGQLWSTLEDMTRFAEECLRPTGKLLSSESWALMRTPVVYEGTQPTMAIGWRCTTINGEICVYHGGADPGYVSYLILAPDQQIGVVLHTNAAPDPGEIEYLGNRIMQDILENG